MALPDEVDWKPARVSRARRVTIVGAGVAGLEAAWVAAARGHAVTVLGAGNEVGGSTRLHAALPGGESLSSVYDYQYLAARRAGVRFELGLTATAEDVLATAPEAVVLATGSTMLWPRSLPLAWQAEGLIPDLRSLCGDLLGVSQSQGGRAVLFDMDHTEGTYSAVVLLHRLFDEVVLVTPRERFAVDTPLVSSLGIYRRLSKLGVTLVPLHELAPESALDEGRVSLRHFHTGALQTLDEVAVVTFATPRKSNDALAAPLRAAGLEVHLAGDCHQPRPLLLATADGHRLGNLL